jgi:GH25 family lysozyme M1 (1,4-beta-N-acetylmuramidase)
MTAPAGLPGIDVAYLQGSVDWRAVAASGVAFAFVRTGESTYGEPDLSFRRNFDAAREAGIVAGGYHVLHWDRPTAEQAKLMRLRMHDFAAGRDMPPAIDFEWIAGRGCDAPAVRVCEDFAKALADAFGVAPILYSSIGFLGPAVRPGTPLAALDLWAAHYGVSIPTVPSAWPTWRFHQWIGNGGKVPGVAVDCDRDVFHGDRAAFDAWLRRTAGDTDPAPPPTLRSLEPPRAESVEAPLTASLLPEAKP